MHGLVTWFCNQAVIIHSYKHVYGYMHSVYSEVLPIIPGYLFAIVVFSM